MRLTVNGRTNWWLFAVFLSFILLPIILVVGLFYSFGSNAPAYACDEDFWDSTFGQLTHAESFIAFIVSNFVNLIWVIAFIVAFISLPLVIQKTALYAANIADLPRRWVVSFFVVYSLIILLSFGIGLNLFSQSMITAKLKKDSNALAAENFINMRDAYFTSGVISSKNQFNIDTVVNGLDRNNFEPRWYDYIADKLRFEAKELFSENTSLNLYGKCKTIISMKSRSSSQVLEVSAEVFMPLHYTTLSKKFLAIDEYMNYFLYTFQVSRLAIWWVLFYIISVIPLLWFPILKVLLHRTRYN